ncbi:lasso peptide biosynthesis B2 protein [Nocardioides montaniterrae]
MTRHRLRVLEAMVLVLGARLLRHVVPMRRWAAILGAHGPATSPIVTGPLGGVEQEVSAAVWRGAVRLHANCLEQAVAASVMLRVRRTPGVVVIGLDVADPSAVPHAWLVGGSSGLVVCGGDEGGHRPVNQFVPASLARR